MCRLKFLVLVLLVHLSRMCDCQTDVSVLDIATPINASLSAFYKRSFAYYTVKERLPRILTQTLDGLVRNKDKIAANHGTLGREEVKKVVGEISKLKYEVQTNKTMRSLVSDAPDVKFYNDYLMQQQNANYFTAIWLHTECYMYRRVREAFELTEHLKDYDPFQAQKRQVFTESLQPMGQLSEHLLAILNQANDTEVVKDEFIRLLKFNLWGNKCDLSFSSGVVEGAGDPFEVLKDLEPNILSDQSEEIWNAVSDKTHPSQIVDIVFDNAGYELFTDLCVADFMVTHGLAQKVRLYVKSIPWFISDTMAQDFAWTLEQLQKSDDANLKTLGDRWAGYVRDQTWTVVDDDFWTYPVDFSQTDRIKPQLYRRLSEAKFVFFKGDLNYRKLFGEKNWDPTTPCNVALQGFGPAKLGTLRTLKCHLVCGLKEGVVDELDAKEPDWKETGKYGVIQYCDLIVPPADSS